MLNESWSQSWRRGKPIFFENGKRVSLQRGFELFKQGRFFTAPHLARWFSDNGFNVEKS